MKEITKKVYFCDHCNRLYQRGGACEKHETFCAKNPNNMRPCFDCKHLCKKEGTVYFDNFMLGDCEETRLLLYCGKIECFLFSPKSEHKKYWFDTGDIENNPMPKTCSFFESMYITFEDVFAA